MIANKTRSILIHMANRIHKLENHSGETADKCRYYSCAELVRLLEPNTIA